MLRAVHAPARAGTCTNLALAAITALLSACGDGETADAGRRDGGVDSARDAPGEIAPVDVVRPTCGNGRQEPGEACDDGNAMAGDGCNADCTAVEPNFECATPGMPCTRLVVCGDGRVGDGEMCDDRNTNPGDGCDAMCRLEPGWICPTPGIACRAARCGDRIRVDNEDCDDGNAAAGDGCSATCVLEDGWACATVGMPCTRTMCGDRVVAGTEQCDDGNTVLGDGCDPFCRREPRCIDGTCMAVCGDGVRLPSEMCDDANTRPGDGCSPTCEVERGFRCMDRVAMEPTSISVPVVYRDFRGRDLAGGHPDFEYTVGAETGIVGPMLVSGRPAYARGAGGTTPTTTGQAAFNQWYTDVAGVNRTIVDRLTLSRTGPGIYVFDDAAFFPLDGRGWMTGGMEPARTGGHNFHFTSEARVWFEYRGGEMLTFRGDDDVWVFVNSRLAVDLGGVHGAMSGSVTLDAATAMRLSLRSGGIYEAVVFQAERHTSESSYRLTLGGFNAPRSLCESICGDGIVTRFEVCDDGVNDGRYGGCAPGCRMLGPRCGDGMLQRDQGEQCDDGNNRSGDGCSSTCRDENVG